MARKRRKSSKRRGRSVAHPTFAGRKYDCRGKRVRTGKGRKKSPRVFCAKQKK